MLERWSHMTALTRTSTDDRLAPPNALQENINIHIAPSIKERPNSN
jgi:hypothetical protein